MSVVGPEGIGAGAGDDVQVRPADCEQSPHCAIGIVEAVSVVEQHELWAPCGQRLPAKVPHGRWTTMTSSRYFPFAHVLMIVSAVYLTKLALVLLRKVGEPVRAGEPLVQIHYNNDERLEAAKMLVLQAFRVSPAAPTPAPLILERLR